MTALRLRIGLCLNHQAIKFTIRVLAGHVNFTDEWRGQLCDRAAFMSGLSNAKAGHCIGNEDFLGFEFRFPTRECSFMINSIQR